MRNLKVSNANNSLNIVFFLNLLNLNQVFNFFGKIIFLFNLILYI